MRIILAAATLLGFAAIASSATGQPFTFSFTIQVDDASPVSLSASIPAGTSQTLQATDHLKVEIVSPTATGDTATTVVKLVDDSSGKPVVLHTARRVGPTGDLRSFGYAVCHGSTTFQSPLLPAQPLVCQKQTHQVRPNQPLEGE